MPKFRPPNRGRRSYPVSVSAPVGGLNGQDGYVGMAPNEAFQLENWFPHGTSVDTRKGCVEFASSLGGPVEGLEAYTGQDASALLAFAGGSIFDVTVGGVPGTPLKTDRNSDRVTACMFANAGDQFLLIYTGEDTPLHYNPTAGLVDSAITGVDGDPSTLHSPHPFKGRVFLAQNGKLGFYYLDVGAIQGAASYFDLQQQCLKGGALAAITSVSQADMGSGPHDYAVFVTTEGEYLLYAGTDPANVATWELVGRYYGPAPIGRKGWFKFRSDVYFITEEGILSFTQIRQLGQENSENIYLTAKLGRYYTEAAVFKETYGWCGMIYPRGSSLIVNAPNNAGTAGSYSQFVMNTNTNRWTTYKGWNGLSWQLFEGRLYFGTYDGRVMLADEGTTDDGREIRMLCRQAWNTFEEDDLGGMDKQFHFATFAVQSDGAPNIAATLNVNYQEETPTAPVSLAPPEGAQWDVAEWDVAMWAGGASTQSVTVPVGKIGYTASICMVVASASVSLRWFATRVILETAKGLVLQ